MNTHASCAALCVFLFVAGIVSGQQRILRQDGFLDESNDRAVIELEIPEPGFVEIEAVSLDFHPRLEVERPDGEIFSGSYDYRMAWAAFYAPESAIYRVMLSSEAGITTGDGKYLLAVDHAGTRAPLTDDSVVFSALLADADRYGGYSFVDWYAYDMPPTGRAYLSLSSAEFDTVLVAFHADGRKRYNDDIRETTDSALRLSGDPGELVLVGVMSYDRDAVGRYELSATPIDLPEGLDEYAPGMMLELDRAYLFELVGSEHSFEVVLDQHQMVLISMTSDDLIGMFDVTTPQGERWFDTGIDLGAGATLHFVPPESGTYGIIARSYDYHDPTEGVYTLTVTHGGSARQVMSDSCVLDADPVWLRIPAEPNGTLVIDVMSDVFDTVIDLYDPNGELLTSDDDGGEGTNSRIVFTVGSGGAHMLKVYGYSSDDRGPFTVEVRQYGDTL